MSLAFLKENIQHPRHKIQYHSHCGNGVSRNLHVHLYFFFSAVYARLFPFYFQCVPVGNSSVLVFAVMRVL